LRFDELPGALKITAWQAFVKPGIYAATGQDNQDCAAFPFTSVQNRRKPSGRLNAPDQAGNFKMGGDARGQAASFSIEFDSRP